jgi:transposase-like protein
MPRAKTSKSAISTFQLFERFPDAESARVYLESRLWPNGARCPVCGLPDRITVRKAGYYRCNQCAEDFTVRTGTVMERSHIPLHKWLYAMYLLVTARKGISSLQLSKEIGVTQKSAWFLLHRLREACGKDLTKLQGIVEIDHAHFDGEQKERRWLEYRLSRRWPALNQAEYNAAVAVHLADQVNELLAALKAVLPCVLDHETNANRLMVQSAIAKAEGK